jgi:hypothetical protein
MTATTCVMIDAMGVNSDNIPAETEKVGAYVTGSGGVPWTDAELTRFGARAVTINQLPQDPGDVAAMVCDSESGAATIADTVGWAQDRQSAGHRPAVYVQESNLTALIDALITGDVKTADIWLANWNLSEAEATIEVENATGPFPIMAVQFASPSSNPNTFVPGSNKTLSQAQVDLSIANVNWPMRPVVVDIVSGNVELKGFAGNVVYYNHDLGTLGYHLADGAWKRVKLPRS